MKNFLLLLNLLLVLTASAQKPFELNYTYSMNFGYLEDVFDKNDSILKKPEGKEQKELIKFVVESNEKVRKKEVVVYHVTADNLDVPLDSEEYNYVQFSVDTLFTTDDKSGIVSAKPIRKYYDYSEAAYLRFLQEWYYNARDKKIEVVVIGYCPGFTAYDEQGNFRGYMPKYWCKQHPVTLKANNKINDTNIVWAHRVQFQIPVNPTQKLEFLNNRTVPGIKKLFDKELSAILFTQAKNNELEVYNPQSGNKINALELERLLTYTDTIYIDNGVTSEMELRVIQGQINVGDLDPMIVRQTFIFDKNNFTVTSKIKSIVLTHKDWENNRSLELFEIRFPD